MAKYLRHRDQVAAIALALALAAAGCGRNWHKKCTDNGGQVVRFNCHEEVSCMAGVDPDGNMTLDCSVDTVCDERCDGATPEDQTQQGG